jgi:hypothetical protein
MLMVLILVVGMMGTAWLVTSEEVECDLWFEECSKTCQRDDMYAVNVPETPGCWCVQKRPWVYFWEAGTSCEERHRLDPYTLCPSVSDGSAPNH